LHGNALLCTKGAILGGRLSTSGQKKGASPAIVRRADATGLQLAMLF
jgi:hypothetical protein